MAKVTPLPGGMQKPPRAKGEFYVRGGERWGWVACAWPRRYLRTKGFAYQKYVQLEFSLASSWASQASALDQETLRYLAEGCRYTWRDLMIRAMFGRLYELTAQDGTVWKASRDVDPNPQFILDMISQEAGTVLYRDQNGWFALSPGNNGDVLTYDSKNFAPSWQKPASGGGGGAGELLNNCAFGNITYITGGYVQLLSGVAPNAATLTGIMVPVRAADSTITVQAAIYSDGGNKPDALLASSGIVTGVNVGLLKLPFTTPLNVSEGDGIWYGLLCENANLGTANSSTSGQAYLGGQASLPASMAGATVSTSSGGWTCWPY